jgi:hypothetical protein
MNIEKIILQELTNISKGDIDVSYRMKFPVVKKGR